jgi:hypothetical protein
MVLVGVLRYGPRPEAEGLRLVASRLQGSYEFRDLEVAPTSEAAASSIQSEPNDGWIRLPEGHRDTAPQDIFTGLRVTLRLTKLVPTSRSPNSFRTEQVEVIVPISADSMDFAHAVLPEGCRLERAR